MSLDGIVIRALVHELQQAAGARISKIYQPTENEIILHIRGQNTGGKLLLSAHPSLARLHWTQQNWENPAEPPMFCMLLRKHCEGGIIDSIRQVGMERIIWLDIRQRDELGDVTVKRLVLEMMGRHSNLILTDPVSGRIYDSIRHVTPAMSSYRVVLPGVTYVAPPEQHKTHPLDETESEFRQKVVLPALTEGDALNARAAEQAIVQAYTGISPLAAREIVFRAGGRSGGLWPAFRQAMESVAQHRYCPNMAETPDGKMLFSALELTHIQGERQIFRSMHECLDSHFREKAERDLVRQRTADLARLLANEIAKNEKKLLKLEETIREAAEAEHYRKIGELLTAQMHLIRRGDSAAEITDFYAEDQPLITVPLDPQLTPAENAQWYFRKYNKLKNGKAMAEEQMEAARREIAYLESVLQGLASAGPADIEEIREELAEQGYVRERSGAKRTKKKRKGDSPSLLCYTSSEGIPIYVGKNNTQNDYITCRFGRPTDTWLHTKDIPGSHVLIRSPSYGEATLREAAMLAAYYSKAKDSSNVPVDYTQIRHVRKPSGAKPGFVIYERQKTLFVTPDEKAIKALPCEVKT